MLYIFPFIYVSSGDTLTSNDTPYGVTSGVIVSTDQLAMSLLSLGHAKSCCPIGHHNLFNCLDITPKWMC